METKLSSKEFINCSALSHKLRDSYCFICVKKAHGIYWAMIQSWDLRSSWLIHTWYFDVSTVNLFHPKLTWLHVDFDLAANPVSSTIPLLVSRPSNTEYITNCLLWQYLVYNIHLKLLLDFTQMCFLVHFCISFMDENNLSVKLEIFPSQRQQKWYF